MTDQTAAFIQALTGSPDTICEFRVIDDRETGELAKNLRGTLAEMLPTLHAYNQQGWGVFIAVNQLDGRGFKLPNVQSIRAHVVDLDNPLNSHDGYQRACNSPTPPHIAVQSSAQKYHLYWLTEPYAGNDFYTVQQKKLLQLYNGDESITDATRVLRLPGFYHCKGEPQMVTCWQTHNGPRYNAQQIADSLAGINVVERVNARSPLGDPEKAAPDLNWLFMALDLIDPCELIRDEWLPTTAAFKQSGWNHTDEQTLLDKWLAWCARYPKNNLRENMKMWNSIHNSQSGWGRFKRLTHVAIYMGNSDTPPKPELFENAKKAAAELPEPARVSSRPQLPDILDITGKRVWFEGCYFVNTEGRIFTNHARFMNQTQFNGAYGGKEFCLKEAGSKVTNKPWEAALFSIDWQIPKVDHTRFLPSEPATCIVQDELGRDGLNVYVKPIVRSRQGDVSKWFTFLSRILSSPSDVEILDDYLAHCIKYPGHKIPWAVLLQSAEGIGKQMIASVLKYCIGETYTYEPKAEELVSGASRFNAWMKEKTFIVVDEIRVGDRRDLLEGLKKIITDKRIAVEGKGVDQKMEDNVANWLFFSNYKDAIPVSENQRRYCVFYSDLQSARAIAAAGMDKDFFDGMYEWLENQGGYEALAYYYLNHAIEKGSLSHRAPKTSSYDEVIRIGRSPLDVLLDERISSGERGFRGGYISWPMLMKAVDTSSMRSRPPEFAIEQVLETKGFVKLGYTAAPIGGEDMSRPSLIYGLNGLTVQGYDIAQSS